MQEEIADLGFGFLYVREDLRDRIRRNQLTRAEYHFFPYDPRGETVID